MRLIIQKTAGVAKYIHFSSLKVQFPNAIHAISQFAAYSLELREQLIHVCALIRILLLEQDGENLNGWVELQHIGTAPALEPCDSDTGLGSC